MQLALMEVSFLCNDPIDYGILFDFFSFVLGLDMVLGIRTCNDVNVENLSKKKKK
jgi:hypothetical protein